MKDRGCAGDRMKKVAQAWSVFSSVYQTILSCQMIGQPSDMWMDYGRILGLNLERRFECETDRGGGLATFRGLEDHHSK